MGRLLLTILTFTLFARGVSSVDYPRYVTRTRLEVAEDGGYTDLVVAIGTTVEEDGTLISSITRAIEAFSRNLHGLTGFYFRTVRILVPESWAPNEQLYEMTSWESFDNSDIRIDHIGVATDTSICRYAPFTVKPSQCGSSGEFIALTPNFITNPDVAGAFGGNAKALVREWAKYRWGAFDESPTEDGLHFYATSSGDIEATRCSRERTGEWKNSADRPCERSPDGLPEADCTFRDQLTDGEPGQEASLMYRQYIDSIGKFCDKAVRNRDAKLIHNIEAPNQQNVHCDRQSVLEVLRRHPDYSAANRSSPGVGWVRPQYVTVRRTEANIVLVLDRSDSMKNNNRLSILLQAAYNFITRVIPDGYKLGIVEFNDDANDLQGLTAVNDNTRVLLKDVLPLIKPGGTTSIGGGVIEGLNVLAGGPNNSPAGGQMIVISDGVNTAEPDIAKILLTDWDEISTVTIHTIAVGPEVDNDLEDLASRTGGRHYQHTDFSTTLFDVFSQFGFDSSARRNVEFYSAAIELDAGHTELCVVVYIDDTVEGDILFLIGGSSVDSLTTNVSRPDSTSLGPRIKEDDFNLIRYSTDNAVPGNWTLCISKNDTTSKQLSVVVEGRVSSSSAPMSVDAHWALGSISPPDIQALYVTVMKGYIPVANAVVYANVSHGKTAPIIEQPLYDDGVGADVLANDGIYSAYFTRVNGTGRYGAKISVTGVQGRTRVLTSRCLGDASPDSGRRTARSIATDTETGPFQRVVDAGSFKCVGEDRCEDGSIGRLFGPAKVTDLRVNNINLSASEVDLVFTAPGNNLMDGEGVRYTIRFARSFDDLHGDFDRGREVTSVESTFVNIARKIPNLGPRRRQVFTLKIFQSGNFSYVFGLTATDNDGNVSPVSNFASVSAKYFAAPFSAASTVAPPANRPTEGDKDPAGDGNQDAAVNPTGLGPDSGEFPWYFILLGLLLIIILLLMLLLFLCKRRSKKADDPILPRPSTTSRQSEAVTFDNPALRATPDAYNVAYSTANGNVYEGVETPTDYAANFVTVPPTSGYGIPSSSVRHESDGVVRKGVVDSHDPYDDVRGVGTLNRDEVRYSSVTSRPYRATDEGRRSQAKIKETDWRAAGGQNYSMFGVVPDKDAAKLASIKTRGDRATKEKVPL